MLRINLHRVERDEVHLQGELPAAELDFALNDEVLRAEQPLYYDLTVEKLDDALLVTGSLEMVLDCECVRCLKPFEYTVELPDWAVHLPLEGEDKVPIENDSIDLTPFIREDMLLQFPRHPLCEPDCSGLKKSKAPEGAKGAVQDKTTPQTWAQLDKLKL